MALISCPECAKQVSDTAAVCPNCAYPLASTSQQATSSKPRELQPAEKGMGKYPKVLLILVGLFSAFLIFDVIIANTPEGKEKAQARATIDFCWEEQRKALLPDTQHFIAAACEQMENDFLRKYGAKP